MNDSSSKARARALPLVAALLVLGCSPAPSSPPAPTPDRHDSPAISAPPRPPAPGASTPLACCATYEDVKRADGQRVIVVGRYTPVVLKKRPGKPDPADVAPEKPATVSIELDGGMSLMLEVYHRPSGLRSVEEIARFAGKRVEIVGVLHERTPSGAENAQTMIGPYLGAIESMREAPP